MNSGFCISDLKIGDIISSIHTKLAYSLLVVRFITMPDRSRRIVLAIMRGEGAEVEYVFNDTFTYSRGNQSTLVGSDRTTPSWWPHDPKLLCTDRSLARKYAHIPVGQDVGLPTNKEAKSVIVAEKFIEQAVEMLRYAEHSSVAHLRLLELFGATLTPEQKALWMTIVEVHKTLDSASSGHEATRHSVREFTTDLASLPSRHSKM